MDILNPANPASPLNHNTHPAGSISPEGVAQLIKMSEFLAPLFIFFCLVGFVTLCITMFCKRNKSK